MLNPIYQPMVGALVNYVSLGDRDGKFPAEVNAAVITRVRDKENGVVAITVFYPTGFFNMDNVSHSPNGRRGTWSWGSEIAENGHEK